MPRPARRPASALRIEELEAREVPTTLYGLAGSQSLVRFDSASPDVLTAVIPITGNDFNIVAIDFRPATGQLYAVAQRPTPTGLGIRDFQLYTVNASTGVAVPVGARVTTQTATIFAISFDPVADLLVVDSGNSFQQRVDPTTGAVVGATTTVTQFTPAIAYDRRFPGTTQTTLFGFNPTTTGATFGQVVTIGSVNGTPNAASSGIATNLGGPTGLPGFDPIPPPPSLTVAADGTIFLQTFYGSNPFNNGLFTIGANGAATLVKNFSATTSSSVSVRSITAPIGAPESILVGGTVNGSASVFTPATNAAAITATYTAGTAITPFGGLGANVRVANADIDGDGVADNILVTGPGVPIQVAVLSGKDGSVLIAPFDPFPPDAGQTPFTNGGFVSAGDMDKDGRAEFAVSPDTAGGPRVKIFSFVNGAKVLKANFFTVDPNFRGGARTAIGDVNGDGFGDLIVGAGFGGGPRVVILDGKKAINGFPAAPVDSDKLIGDFFAFDSNLRDGSYIAFGDVDGDGRGELIFGPGDGGPLQVLVIKTTDLLSNGAVSAIGSPFARFTPTGLGGDGSGARVGVARTGAGSQVNVIVGAGKNQGGVSKVYPGTSFTPGLTTEPTGGAVLSSGGVLADGIFVG